MKRSLLTLALFLLAHLSIQAQEKITNKEKANHYLNTKGEVCFTFQANSENQFREISQFLSIGHKHISKDNLLIEAYANQTTFSKFLEYGLPYQVSKKDNELLFDPHKSGESPEALAKTGNSLRAAAWDTTWDAYPKYSEYIAKMQYYASTFPTLCSLESIGTTQGGRDLWVLKITDNASVNEGEPEFFYTSTMHGDELVGFPLMIRLIDYLLTNYGTDTEVTNIVDNIEIYINPNANPDASYRTNPTDVINNPIRANNSGQDLNRNYPDNIAGLHDSGLYENETIAFMNFAKSKNFVLSANFHGGTELFNYPYDNAYVNQYTHCDGNYFEFIGVEYATHAQNSSPSGYMTADDDSNVYPSPGVTHGAEWYRVYGGRQDFMNYYHEDKEVTIELSDVKYVNGANLPVHWNYNKQAFLDFIKQASYGIQGFVTDESGNPIVARVEIIGHDKLNTFRMSESGLGEYHKLVKGGNYDVTYSAPGYISQTISVSVIDHNTTIQNVTLVATTPQPVATNDQLCDSGTAELTASGSGTLNWYDNINASSPVSTGPNFTTPTLTSTTSYFVEDVIAKPNIGNTNSNINGANYTSSGRYLIFDCTESVNLEQVTVNAQFDGEIAVELQDSTGKVLNAAIVFVQSGVQTIDLNFAIPVANDLRLVCTDFSTGGLYRNDSGVAFPYANGSLSIKNSSAGLSYYYFFYDWKISSLKSARQEVVATVNPSPTANFTYVVNSLNNGEVSFTNTSNNATSYLWNFGDSSGTSISTNPIYTFETSGTYIVQLTGTNIDCGDNIVSFPVTVTVNETLNIKDNNLSNITVYPNPFKHSVNIKLPSNQINSTNYNIMIYDITGRIIIKNIYQNIQNRIMVGNLSKLSKGNYYIKITDTNNDKTTIKKLIKD